MLSSNKMALFSLMACILVTAGVRAASAPTGVPLLADVLSGGASLDADHTAAAQPRIPVLFDLRAAGVTFGDVLCPAQVLGNLLFNGGRSHSTVVAVTVDPSKDDVSERTAAPRKAALAELGGASVSGDIASIAHWRLDDRPGASWREVRGVGINSTENFEWVLSESKSGAGYAAMRIAVVDQRGSNELVVLRIPHAKRDHVLSLPELTNLFQQQKSPTTARIFTNYIDFTDAVYLSGSVGLGVPEEVAPERRMKLSLGDAPGDFETGPDTLAYWDIATGIDASGYRPDSPGYNPLGVPGPVRPKMDPGALNAKLLGESAYAALQQWQKDVDLHKAVRVVLATSGTKFYFNGRLVFNRILLELARHGVMGPDGVSHPVAFLFVARGTPIDSAWLTEAFCTTCPRSVQQPEKNHLLVDAAIWDFFKFAGATTSGRIDDLEDTDVLHDRVAYDPGEFTRAEAAEVLAPGSEKGLHLALETQEIPYLNLFLGYSDIVLPTTGAGTAVDVTWAEAMRAADIIAEKMRQREEQPSANLVKPVLGMLGVDETLVGPGGDAQVRGGVVVDSEGICSFTRDWEGGYLSFHQTDL